MKTIGRLFLVTSIVFGAGCVRSDWIDRTLVTADLTGVWVGKAYIPHAVTGLIVDVRLELEQEGPKVKGSMRPSGAIPWRNPDRSPTAGPIVGSVAGDVFQFRETNGHIKGQLTVSGDEMIGEVVENVTYRVELRRIN
jgi:hypothetical protein